MSEEICLSLLIGEDQMQVEQHVVVSLRRWPLCRVDHSDDSVNKSARQPTTVVSDSQGLLSWGLEADSPRVDGNKPWVFVIYPRLELNLRLRRDTIPTSSIEQPENIRVSGIVAEANPLEANPVEISSGFHLGQPAPITLGLAQSSETDGETIGPLIHLGNQ